MIAIDFMDETESLKQQELDFVQKILEHAAKEEGLGQSEVSVTFVTNEMIRDINREYRGKDQPTDVISFAMEELGEGETAIIGSPEPRMLGDIIISLDRTKEQAADYGHSFERVSSSSSMRSWDPPRPARPHPPCICRYLCFWRGRRRRFSIAEWLPQLQRRFAAETLVQRPAHGSSGQQR